MKKNIHPASRKICFLDVSCGASFMIESTARTTETTPIGNFPLMKIETSSASHPFYNGAMAVAPSASSRSAKFKQKFPNY